MMSDVILRRAEKNDMEKIMLLVCDVFEREQGIPRELCYLPEEHSPIWWCAEEGGAIIGAVASYEEAGQTHFGRFVIEPEYRGRGIGTRLLRFAVEDVFSQGVEQIHTESRTATVRILEKMGGRVVGEAFPFYKGDCTPVRLCREDYVR